MESGIMTRSTVNPGTIWLRKTELSDAGLFLVLRVRSNIRQITVEDEGGGSHIEYEYDEIETRYPVPDTVLSPDDIKAILVDKEAEITSKAGKEKVWREIHARPVAELRPVAEKL